MTQLWKTGK